LNFVADWCDVTIILGRLFERLGKAIDDNLDDRAVGLFADNCKKGEERVWNNRNVMRSELRLLPEIAKSRTTPKIRKTAHAARIRTQMKGVRMTMVQQRRKTHDNGGQTMTSSMNDSEN
jgi:hypothetical protein